MMENARPMVVPIDAAPPPSKSVAERGKKAAGRTKRCEHKRKRSEKSEQKEEPEPRNNALRAQTSTGTCKRACIATDAITTAPTTKTSSKKHPVKKQKKARATISQRALTMRVSSKKGKGRDERVRRHSSQYRGVYWNKRENTWKVQIRYDGKRHHLGYFEDEDEAARAYDQAARAQHGEKAQLNFPAEGESGSRKSSKYRGISWDKMNNKWRAQIMHDGKKHYLGSFDDEEEAAKAYDRAAKVHKGEVVQVNFPTKQRI
jgi:hypothetical protein